MGRISEQWIEQEEKREMAEEKEDQMADKAPPAKVEVKSEAKIILYHWTQSFSSQKVSVSFAKRNVVFQNLDSSLRPCSPPPPI